MQVPLDDFYTYIISEKGLSLNTQKAYRSDLVLFRSFLQEKKISAYEKVTEETVLEFLSFLREQGYAEASSCRLLMTLKVFFRFLKREGYLQKNVTLYLQSPEKWKLLPYVPSPEEVEKLLEEPSRENSEESRDRAILEVLYGSGLRVSEVCGLHIADVDEGSLRVRGKGNKDRIVPVGSRAGSAIDHYLSHYREDDRPELFLGKGGRKLDRVTVWKRLKYYAKRAGISGHLTPHGLRHAFATHLLDNGADLRVIQEMLGHADISTTDRYTHMTHKRLVEAFNRFHPRS